MWNVYRLLVVKRPLRSPRCRWVYNIKMDFGEMGWRGIDWIGLAQDRDKWRALANAVLSLWVPQNAGRLSSGSTTGGLSSSAQLHTWLVASYQLKYN
jgi:hypothetical protein